MSRPVDHAERYADGRCIHCDANIGHYNGCPEDPDPPCTCGGDGPSVDAFGIDADCPYHSADPSTLAYPPGDIDA